MSVCVNVCVKMCVCACLCDSNLWQTLDEMERLGVVHTDLKPDNIRWHPRRRGDHHITIIDLDMAVFVGPRHPPSLAEPDYTPRDRLDTGYLPLWYTPLGKYDHDVLTHADDRFAVQVMLFEAMARLPTAKAREAMTCVSECGLLVVCLY